MAARNRTAPLSADAFIAAIDAFSAALDRLRADPLMRELPPETVGGLFTLGFAFEEMRRELPELGNRLAEFARPAETG